MSKVNPEDEIYLGDGLYASDDHGMIGLRAPREDGDDWVFLNDEILQNLLSYIERQRHVIITVTRQHEVLGAKDE